MKYQTLIRTTATLYLLIAVLGCTSTRESKEGFLHVDKKVISVAKTATETRFTVSSTQHWQLSKPNTGAEWITNIAADNGTSNASSITGKNDAFITITTTANPNDAGRNTKLTLRAINRAGKALTDPTPVTISFTQLGTTHTGNVSVTTQAQVNALRTSLKAGATRIVGNVTIGPEEGESNISDLSPLTAITEITGNLVVRNNPDLPNLMGLNQLQSIGDGFLVFSNATLTSLGNFITLQSIGDFFSVSSNASLTSLENFSTLQSIGGSFRVSNNSALTSLGDFPTLQSIGGYFYVYGNNVLTSLGGFPMLASIGSADGVYVPSTDDGKEDGVSIVVEANDRLQDCCVLTAFLNGATNAVSGQVFINNNDPGCNSTTQVNCDPFLQVDQKVVLVAKTTAKGRVDLFSRGHWQFSKPNTGAEWITNIAADNGTSDDSSITGENDAFITITTTANPNDAGRSTTLTLRAIDQTGKALTDLAPVTIFFTQLGTTHTGSITLRSQSSVNALTLPANATAIQGDLIIGNYSSNSDITDLQPLSGITHITGRVAVVGNDRLVSLGSLGNLQSIGGSFEVGGYDEGNASLTSLGDFSRLQSIGDLFWVGGNASLTSLGNFSALQSIGDNFKVGGFYEMVRAQFDAGNTYLTSLGDFSALQSIGGSFEVIANGSLTSLGGFPMLTSIGSADGVDVSSTNSWQDGVSIVVEHNRRLQDCCVLTEFLRDAKNAVSGKIFIKYNAPGCNSTTQVNCDPFLQVGQKVVFATKTTGEGTLDLFSTGHWQLSKPNTGAEWITNIVAGGGNSDASSITGENHAFITVTTTTNPSNTGRSTTLTLRAIDQAGKALTDPTPVTISFTQLGIAHVGNITLQSQADVNALVFPANATTIQGNLIIGNYSSNSDITDLRPLSGITHVTGRVQVGGNDRLVSLSLLGNLQTIGGSFYVSSNATLTSLEDFSTLQTIGGSFGVYRNAVLTSLGDFSGLQAIGGSFKVGGYDGGGNNALTSLGDFTALQSVGGIFYVYGNVALTSLGGFPILASIGRADEIYVSSSWQDGVSIVVEGNKRLQDCCVLTAFLSGAKNAVSRKVSINNNATGCSSEGEIKPCAGGGSTTKGK